MKLTVTFFNMKGKLRTLTFLLEDRREIVLFAKDFLVEEPKIAQFIYSLVPEKLINDIIKQREMERCQAIKITPQS